MLGGRRAPRAAGATHASSPCSLAAPHDFALCFQARQSIPACRVRDPLLMSVPSCFPVAQFGGRAGHGKGAAQSNPSGQAAGSRGLLLVPVSCGPRQAQAPLHRVVLPGHAATHPAELHPIHGGRAGSGVEPLRHHQPRAPACALMEGNPGQQAPRGWKANRLHRATAQPHSARVRARPAAACPGFPPPSASPPPLRRLTLRASSRRRGRQLGDGEVWGEGPGVGVEQAGLAQGPGELVREARQLLSLPVLTQPPKQDLPC